MGSSCAARVARVGRLVWGAVLLGARALLASGRLLAIKFESCPNCLNASGTDVATMFNLLIPHYHIYPLSKDQEGFTAGQLKAHDSDLRKYACTHAPASTSSWVERRKEVGRFTTGTKGRPDHLRWGEFLALHRRLAHELRFPTPPTSADLIRCK